MGDVINTGRGEAGTDRTEVPAHHMRQGGGTAGTQSWHSLCGHQSRCRESCGAEARNAVQQPTMHGMALTAKNNAA